MDVKTELITPEYASGLLEKNFDNFRRLEIKRVDKYCTDMLSGDWDLNGETIKLSCDDTLIDGQHRLAAVAKSGVAVSMLVCRGVASSAMNIDRGKPRRVSDWLARSGFPNATALPSIAKLAILHSEGKWGHGQPGSRLITDDAICEFVSANNPGLQQSISLSRRCSNRPELRINATALGAVFFIGSRLHLPEASEVCVWFSNALATGEDINKDDAVYHLRTLAMRAMNKRHVSKWPIEQQRGCISIAWNRTVAMKPIRSLSYRGIGPKKSKMERIINESDARSKYRNNSGE